MLDVVTRRRSATRIRTRRATTAAAERLGRATSLALVVYCCIAPRCAKAEDGQGVAAGLPCSNAAEGCLPNATTGAPTLPPIQPPKKKNLGVSIGVPIAILVLLYFFYKNVQLQGKLKEAHRVQVAPMRNPNNGSSRDTDTDTGAFDFNKSLIQLVKKGEIELFDRSSFGSMLKPGTGTSTLERRAPMMAKSVELASELNVDEIERGYVRVGEKIGGGNFGNVFVGSVKQPKTRSHGGAGNVAGKRTITFDVAIKMVKNDDDGFMSRGQYAVAEEELLKEATVMALIDEHPNICGLIGVVTVGHPIMVLETLCARGSLIDVLKSRRQRDLKTMQHRSVTMALQVACGMKQLSEKHFIIHRDLAARNVMVDSLWVCKVADFGLSRAASRLASDPTNQNGYYRSHGGMFPVRWSAPETMSSSRFSVASDVWR